MKTLSLVLVLFFIHYGSTATYRAAVFEHYPLVSDTQQNTIRKNLDEYKKYADKAKAQSADILVFPEYGLTNLVKDPEQYAIEINGTNDIIKEIRDMAIDRQVYLVINLLERVQGVNTKTQFYNTDLVFDRDGNIILKYRKINLFDEPNLTPGDANQTVTFTTNFGATFGIFTGFDILFDNPSRKVLENAQVTDIVYPTAWYASLPFYTALTVQHGYALANGVNLLAANYGKPQESHGGSGIYLADGKIAEAYISDSSSSKPIIQDVIKISTKIDKSVCASLTPFGLPTDVGKSNVTNFKTQRDFVSSEYTFANVDLGQRNSSTQVCDGDFCCTFTIIVDQSTTSSDKYKVMAFDGFDSYNGVDYRTRICSLLACENDSPDSCGTRINSTNTKFTKVTVQGNVKDEDGTYYVPVTLNSYLLPIRETLFCNNHNGTNSTYIKFETYKAQENVVVFGIFGKTNISAASSVHAFGLFFLVVFSVIKYSLF